MFGSAYFCDQIFFSYDVMMKQICSTKTSRHLNTVLRISTSKIKPTINKLVDNSYSKSTLTFTLYFSFVIIIVMCNYYCYFNYL